MGNFKVSTKVWVKLLLLLENVLSQKSTTSGRPWMPTVQNSS